MLRRLANEESQSARFKLCVCCPLIEVTVKQKISPRFRFPRQNIHPKPSVYRASAGLNDIIHAKLHCRQANMLALALDVGHVKILCVFFSLLITPSMWWHNVVPPPKYLRRVYIIPQKHSPQKPKKSFQKMTAWKFTKETK